MRGIFCCFLGLLVSYVAVASEAPIEAPKQLAPVELHLWHSRIYSHRPVLERQVRAFELQHPGLRVHINYRETEELRSSFQSAAMGGSGPEIIYGPNDLMGTLGTMGLVQPLDGDFTQEELQRFDPRALTHWKNHLYQVGDTLGNFLALIYNRKLISEPPTTLEELIAIAKKNSGAGRYGLVFNFTEPYFLVPWFAGFGESFYQSDVGPQLATRAAQQSFALMIRLRDKEKIIPAECDYETANALFKQEKAAMIINGDWSWGDYRAAGLDFGVAPLPRVDSTGLWPAPLVGTTGYAVNANIKNLQIRTATIELLKFLVASETQLEFAKTVHIMPSLISLQKSEIVRSDPLLAQAQKIIEKGMPMPADPEIRSVWDSLRRQYQLVLAGKQSPEAAAQNSQKEALQGIAAIHSRPQPQRASLFVFAIIALSLAVFWFFKSGRGMVEENWRLLKERPTARLGLLLAAPALLAVFLVVLYPLLYNLAISLSDFSLVSFDNWRIIGFANYSAVLSDPQFYYIFAKTLLWTVSNLVFHVGLGLALALCINQIKVQKSTVRVLLILPWAVPQYITALTWRGMFNQEFGPINLALQKLFSLSPLQWLSSPVLTFSACVLTNVWLGFPFMMVVALGALQSIPQDLYDAARLDGASAWQRFRNITWPLLLPVMRPAILLGSVWTFNNLNVVWLVSNGGEPADTTHILVSYVYKSAFNLYRYGYASALSIVIFILLLVLAGVSLRQKIRHINLGGAP